MIEWLSEINGLYCILKEQVAMEIIGIIEDIEAGVSLTII